jgi:ketosteroid isomerase-like protein
MKITMPFILLIFFFSCTVKKREDAIDMRSEKAKLIQADKAFSDLSEKEGMKNAFLEYIDSNGVLLKADHMPIIGAGAIDYLIQVSDTAFTLNWQPQHAFVSKSADLGYTYGIYALHSNTRDTVLYGTYVSIWKKQADGKWKFVLDSGNEGIGDEAQ